MHEVNGFWFPYGSCHGKEFCQIPQAEYKKYFHDFKVALLAGVRPTIRRHLLFVNALNFGSHTKSGVNWIHGDVRGWILPEADIIGVSIYDAVRDKNGQRLTFKARGTAGASTRLSGRTPGSGSPPRITRNSRSENGEPNPQRGFAR
jgi:hypothetical protein